MEYKPADVIYIKFLRFADSNEIDYRMNGRPYLIYKVKDNKLYLLKIGSKALGSKKYCFEKVNIIVKGKKKVRESYVDMRNIIIVDREAIDRAYFNMFYEERSNRRLKINSKISQEEFKEVCNAINILRKLKVTRIIQSKTYNPNKNSKKK